MRFEQILIKRGADLVPVRLGEPMDNRLAGHEAAIVVKIEKAAANEVTAIQRMSGGAWRFTFAG